MKQLAGRCPQQLIGQQPWKRANKDRRLRERSCRWSWRLSRSTPPECLSGTRAAASGVSVHAGLSRGAVAVLACRRAVARRKGAAVTSGEGSALTRCRVDNGAGTWDGETEACPSKQVDHDDGEGDAPTAAAGRLLPGRTQTLHCGNGDPPTHGPPRSRPRSPALLEPRALALALFQQRLGRRRRAWVRCFGRGGLRRRAGGGGVLRAAQTGVGVGLLIGRAWEGGGRSSL